MKTDSSSVWDITGRHCWLFPQFVVYVFAADLQYVKLLGTPGGNGGGGSGCDGAGAAAAVAITIAISDVCTIFSVVSLYFQSLDVWRGKRGITIFKLKNL